jgi:hypothetical protein
MSMRFSARLDTSHHHHYQNFLLRDPPKELEDVPLAVRARMWYVVLRNILAVLSEMFSKQLS